MPKSLRRTPSNAGISKPSRGEVFGHPLRAAIYARVSTSHQQTIPMQLRELRAYCARRKWSVAMVENDVLSGRRPRPGRELVMQAARRREVDVVVVWKLDRWGRSLADLVTTLQELLELEIPFVSVSEAVDLTTTTGRAMAGMLAVFAQFEHELRAERVRDGIAAARLEGRKLGRPRTAATKLEQVRRLARAKVNQSEIARRLKISRTSVRRLLA